MYFNVFVCTFVGVDVPGLFLRPCDFKTTNDYANYVGSEIKVGYPVQYISGSHAAMQLNDKGKVMEINNSLHEHSVKVCTLYLLSSHLLFDYLKTFLCIF